MGGFSTRLPGERPARQTPAPQTPQTPAPNTAPKRPRPKPRAPTTIPYSQPHSSAIRAASARLRASSFCIAADRWLRTVPGERWIAAASSATVG